MSPQFVQGSVLWETLWAIGLLLIFILGGWLVDLGLRFARHRLERTKAKVGPQLLESLSRPVFILIVVEGLLLALSSPSYLAQWKPYLAKASIAVTIIVATYAVARIGGVLLVWYLRSRTIRRKALVDEGLTRFLRRIMVLIIYAIGVLIMMDYLGIRITPILAGLGIGGLAVALALQPLLGNFFASTQIISDRVVRVGDYIEMDDGTRGYVTDVGWRSTRIRTVYNNLVIVPNSRLAASVITNYQNPTTAMGIIVTAGVSYSSDLAQVERVALEVAREVVKELDEAIKEFEPIFRYEQFGDSNIDFWIWVQANDRIGSFRVKSELIKRLHARFAEEGITINYPVRHLTWAGSDGVPPVMRGENAGSGGSGKGGSSPT